MSVPASTTRAPAAGAGDDDVVDTGGPLPRASAESVGIGSGSLAGLVDALADPELGLHGLVVVRHGTVVAEGSWLPYRADTPHSVFSVSKSLTATAVGLAVADGRLSVDERVLDVLPSHATAAARACAGDLTVRHLLTMATGHGADTMTAMRVQPGADWVQLFLETPTVCPPGERFVYDNGASYLLSVIVSSRTGRSLVEQLTPRLFGPLGIEDPVWATDERGVCLGSTGLRLRTGDLAKIGQLFLQRGRWHGRQLVDESWIETASRAHVATDGEPEPDRSQGYGFQFWRSRHGGYRADGAFGQFVLVLPDQDVVVAISAGTSRTQAVLTAVWDHLLPALHERALAPDPAAAAALAERLGNLQISVPAVLPADPAAAQVLAGRAIRLPSTRLGVETVTVGFAPDVVTMTLAGGDAPTESVTAGRDRWLPGRSVRWPDDELTEVQTANRAGWLDERTLVVHQQCVETPFERRWLFRVDDADRVLVRVGLDLPFWEPRTEVLVGRLDPRRDGA